MAQNQPIRSDFTAGFQVKYILAMAIGAVLTTSAIYLYLDQGLGANYFDALVTLSTIETALTSSLVITFCLQLFLIFLLTIGINLFVSHKIAGPVFRYEDSLEKATDGDLSVDVRTRDGDQLKTMVVSMNNWQNYLREVYQEAAELDQELMKQISALNAGRSVDLEEIRHAVSRVRKAMDGFPDGEKGGGE